SFDSFRTADDLGDGPDTQFVELFGDSAAPRNRQEKLDFASGLRQYAARDGRADTRGDCRGLPHAPSSYPDDDLCDYCRAPADGAWSGNWRRAALGDCRDHYRRAVTLPVAYAASGSGGLRRGGPAGTRRAASKAGKALGMAPQGPAARRDSWRLIAHDRRH